MDPSSPIYPSNLSAALYEQAKYSDTLKAIGRSYARLDDDSKANLLPKLSIRFAKALSCGILGGSITLEDCTANETQLISELRAISELESSHPECKRAWNVWKRVEQSLDHVKSGSKDARTRLVSLPVRKKTG